MLTSWISVTEGDVHTTIIHSSCSIKNSKNSIFPRYSHCQYAMAEIILFEFAKVVLARLSPLLVDEVRLFLGVENELDKLETDLSAIKAVLQDAERQQRSQSVRDWLQNLEDLVYDIDDLFDEIAIEVSEREKSKDSWFKQVSRFLSCSNPHLFQSKLAHKIREISARLEVVANARRNFRFHSEFVNTNEGRETHSKLPKSEILGRDDDQKAIIDLVLNCSDCEFLSVVPIVGFGGVGKTTLAKLIFNDPQIQSKFDVKLWVYASENFSVKKILEQIVRFICGENKVLNSVQQMQIMLEEELKTKKYFLILDDLWNEDPNVWENLRELLDGGARGSTVVVTTRVPRVASIVKTVADEYTLEPLSRDICLLIFKKLAFGEGNFRRIQPNLEEMAGRIVDRCGGLPLAVTFLGNLLHGVTDEIEWQEIVRKLEHGHEDILKVLKLSYDQLPSYLKPCFRSLACYLQGSMTDAQVFISTWMALGFLHSSDQSIKFEHTGRKYINELLSKSFLHREEYNFGDLIREFEIHDFVHDLAKYTAGDEMAVVNCETNTVPRRVRYVTFREDDLKGKRFPSKVFKTKKARVFTLYTLEQTPAEFLRDVISNLKCLRVLNLRGCDIEILPDSIGELKHLRMLDLGDNVRIKQLPDSVSTLLNLQSLFLDCCTDLQTLPQKIDNLENLRYLSLTSQEENLSYGLGGLNNLRTLFLFNCTRLNKLPYNFACLENLEQLWIAYCEKLNPIWDSVPDIDGAGALELNNLHTLNIEGVPNLVTLRIFGKSLRRLGIVKCHGLSHLSGWIGRYTSLQALSIIDCPNLMALPKSFQNLRQLQRLKIVACPELSKRCARDTGVDWPLISHVPEIILLDQEEM